MNIFDFFSNKANSSTAGSCAREDFDMGISDDFTQLKVGSVIDVKLELAEKTSVHLSCPANVRSAITAVVKGDTLVIDSGREFNSIGKIQITVKTPHPIRNVVANGASKVDLLKAVANEFYAAISDAATLEASGVSVKVSIKASGASKVSLNATGTTHIDVVAQDASSVTSRTASVMNDVRSRDAATVTLVGHPGMTKFKADFAAKIRVRA